MKSIKDIINESENSSLCPYSNFSHKDCSELKLEEGVFTVCPKPFLDDIEVDDGDKYSLYFALKDNKIFELMHNDSQNQWLVLCQLSGGPDKKFFCPKCGKNIFDQLK